MPIHHVSFPSQHLLAATFLRFQEHYESPAFAGRKFDWEEYMDWYAADRGAFTYLTDWNGFNIPSRVFAPFRQGEFDPLTRKERRLLDLLDGVPEPFYVIGTHDADAETLAHEIVHGLYSVFPDYGEAVRAILKERPLPGIRKVLGRMGYGEHVFDDEINAYVLTGLDDRMAKVERGAVPKARSELHALFTARFDLDIRRPRGLRALSKRVRHHRFD